MINRESTPVHADARAKAARGLAHAVDQLLSDVDLNSLDDDSLRELVVQTERAAQMLQAVQGRAMIEMVDRTEREATVDLRGSFGDGHPQDFLVDEIAVLLRCTKSSANLRLSTAFQATQLPAVGRAWRAGHLDASKVRSIAEGVAPLMAQVGDQPEFVDEERVDQLVSAAVAYATDHTVGQLRPWLARRVVRLSPEAAELRRQRAMADRRVVITPGSDGMSELWALLPSVQARQIQQTLSAVAHSAGADDPRTADQRRVDGMVEILLGEREAPPVALSLVVAGDAAAISAELTGVGAITAEQVAELLAQAGTVRTRVIPCDATTGYLTPSAAVEARYRPSGRLDQDVRARDVTCRFPGCRRAAQGSASGVDVDHTVPWPSGDTSLGNLACLCRRHHRLKHIGTWTLEQRGDGVLRWTGPTGRTYETTPWEYTDPVPT